MRCRSSSIGLMLISLCILVGYIQDVDAADGEFEQTVVMLPSAPGPEFQVGTGRRRHVATSNEIPSKTGAPVIAVAERSEVWYIDAGDGSVLRKVRVSDDELVVMSQNGEYVSVHSQIPNRRTGKTIHDMRILDWTGRELWNMRYRRLAKCEPTPTGGFVAFPTLHPRDQIIHGYEPKDDSDPPPRRHGLLVYDNQGSLVMEGVGYDECRAARYKGVFCPEGRFLVFAYVWVPPQNREDRGFGGDRTCLVLYDLQEGIEKWRRYFDGQSPSRISVSHDASRIAFFAGTKGRWYDSADHRLYLLDESGNVLCERSVEGCESFPPSSLEFSSDGEVFAFKTVDNRLYLCDSSNGTELRKWEYSGSKSELPGFGLLSDGTIQILIMKGSAYGDHAARELTVFGMESTPEIQLSADFIQPVRPMNVGSIGYGAGFWVLYQDRIELMRRQVLDDLDEGVQR